MMKKGKTAIKSYMTMSYSFAGMRLQDCYITPVDWNLTVNLIATGKKGKTKEEIESRAGALYQKLYFWLETNLQGILAVDVTKEEDLYLANLSANIAMYCPGNPGDDMLVQLLHAKLSSLTDEELLIGEIHLKGSDTSLEYTFDCESDEYSLPATTEYCGEHIVRDTKPWWFRDDGFCFEFIKTHDADDSFSTMTDPMDEFRKIITELANTHIAVNEPAKIIQLEKWKPKTV
jgi:hypothetical protein